MFYISMGIYFSLKSNFFLFLIPLFFAVINRESGIALSFVYIIFNLILVQITLSQESFIYVSYSKNIVDAQAYCQETYNTSLLSIHSYAVNTAMRQACIAGANDNLGGIYNYIYMHSHINLKYSASFHIIPTSSTQQRAWLEFNG